ncbi:TPM domain-containing protein [Bifidobacterium avesanii]|uniref:TPM domain-containing protein n=1 Tax=Bifidobacterium avesanii TaxID=1798157 RepID=A0A7K3TH88_9BIFI|nr:TPM domain-containing protein [Bifidobacterium avesanii]KAB8295609.1 membrane associated protein [Bifidobacterium avesanii]NEG77613.1 TPM domain-containing protein [Bifidobacterium avesanii]
MWALLLCLILALGANIGLGGATAWADDASGDASISVSDSIIDTENLLGEDTATVTDAIDKTKAETGVSVKLMYLPKFREGVDPEQWTKQTLDSTDPEANTVMLAVATQDGNLVVAVSSNSEEWLRKQSTVDELSQAALGPIVADSTNPDWPGSAKAMMDAIARIKKSSTSSTASSVGVIVFAVVLGVVIVASVLLFIVHKRSGQSRHGGGRKKPGSGRRRAKDGRPRTSHKSRKSHKRPGAGRAKGDPTAAEPSSAEPAV